MFEVNLTALGSLTGEALQDYLMTIPTEAANLRNERETDTVKQRSKAQELHDQLGRS